MSKSKATIVITRYNEKDTIVSTCLEAIGKQKKINLEVLFLDQQKSATIRKICNNLSKKNVKIKYLNIDKISLSYARNLGIKMSKDDIVLFTDADAIPRKDWAINLYKILIEDNDIAIVGGISNPLWSGKQRWYTKSNIVREMYSLINLGNKITRVKKIVGVNFGINKCKINFKEYFDNSLGRRPGSLLGGEETDLCKKTIEKGLEVYYTPKAIVNHQISKERQSVLWLMRRFYFQGISRAKFGGIPQTYSNSRNIYDWAILLLVIWPFIVGYIFEKVSFIKNL